MKEKYDFGENGVLSRVGKLIYSLFDKIFDENRFRHNVTTGLILILKWTSIIVLWGIIILGILYNLIFGYRMWTLLFLGIWIFIEICVRIGYSSNN